MLQYPLHDSFREYIKELNHIYLKYNALHYDYNPTNFMWDDCKSITRCVYAIRRKSADGDIIAVLNFSDWHQSSYAVNIGDGFKAELLIDSDNQRFSGRTPDGSTVWKQDGNRLIMNIPPYSGRMFFLKRVWYVNRYKKAVCQFFGRQLFILDTLNISYNSSILSANAFTVVIKTLTFLLSLFFSIALRLIKKFSSTATESKIR